MMQCELAEPKHAQKVQTADGTLTPGKTWGFGALCVAGLLIAGLFAPTIGTNFDFADDGVTAHPLGLKSFSDFHRNVWSTTYAEFVSKGPYRPVAWYFWIGQQEFCQGDALGWRGFRFFWTALSAVVFLWFLGEMGFSRSISFLTTIIAMWNPYRAEVWLSPTFCEGIALPFSLAGLVCAYRAARSEQAWRWDLAAMTCALLAVGCKNVFAVVIPAQMFLRVCHPDLSLREGIKQFGWRAALLGSMAIFPIIHFACYRLTMHANRYDLAWDPRQPLRMLNALLGSIGKDFLGPALIVTLLLVVWSWWRGWLAAPADDDQARANRSRDRAALGAGLILFIFGWGAYVPLQGVAGRYTFPGVWGLDLLCALLWTRLALTPIKVRYVAYGLVACGLLACVIADLGKQEKNTARIGTLWEALACVEEQVPIGGRISWMGVADRKKTEELEIGEGIHFRWHLEGRGRRDLRWVEDPLRAPPQEHLYVVTSSSAPLEFSSGPWELLKESRCSYWFGQKEVVCCVWRRAPSPVD